MEWIKVRGFAPRGEGFASGISGYAGLENGSVGWIFLKAR